MASSSCRATLVFRSFVIAPAPQSSTNHRKPIICTCNHSAWPRLFPFRLFCFYRAFWNFGQSTTGSEQWRQRDSHEFRRRRSRFTLHILTAGTRFPAFMDWLCRLFVVGSCFWPFQWFWKSHCREPLPCHQYVAIHSKLLHLFYLVIWNSLAWLLVHRGKLHREEAPLRSKDLFHHAHAWF